MPKATSEWKIKINFDENITKIKVYGGKNEDCAEKMCTFTNPITKFLNKDESLRLGIKNREAKTTEINIVGIQFNDEVICGSSINVATATSTTKTTPAMTTGMMFFIKGGYRNRYYLIDIGSGSCNFCKINKGFEFCTSERSTKPFHNYRKVSSSPFKQ